MYEAFFQLASRPFPATPRPELYFPGGAAEHARGTLARCIERAEGPALLVGPAGTGKSLLCQILARQFRDQFRVAALVSGRLATRRALLQAILFELGLPYRDMDEGELRLSLVDHLAPGPACPHGLLLIVDEAHTLPLRLLEEVRLITNLVRDGQPRVRLLLAGSGALEERFASPKLESFNQRIAARCYLEALRREETEAYVHAQIAAVGGNSHAIFAGDAPRAVFQATDGIPRLINQVCDHALMLAFAGGQGQVSAAGIEEAWADLQQLPAPWAASKPAPAAAAGETIEFGSLDGPLEHGPLEQDAPHAPATTTQHATAAQAMFSTDSWSTTLNTFDPATRIDEIQRQVAFAANDPILRDLDSSDLLLGSDEFRPASAGRLVPEVELTFAGTLDPFADDFEEEEIVIDRYAALDAGALANRPRVSSAEGREMAKLFPETSAPPRPALSITGIVEAEHETQLDEDVDLVYPPDDDAGGAYLALAPEFLTDDRDIIVVDDRDELEAQPLRTPSRPTGTAKRQEYRNLFAKLRGR